MVGHSEWEIGNYASAQEVVLWEFMEMFLNVLTPGLLP